MTTIILKMHPLAVREIRRHFTRSQKQQQRKEARRKEQHRSSEHLFVKSTEAESSATPQLPRVKPYEEAVPIGHFMRARSEIRSSSLPIQTLDQDLSTSPELKVHSPTSQSEADISIQSPTSEHYTSTLSEVRGDENIILDIGAEHSVDSDTVIQTGTGPDLVDS